MGNRHLFWFSVSFVALVMIGSLCNTVLSLLVAMFSFIAITAYLLCRVGNKRAAILVIIAAAVSLVWQTVYFERDKLPDELFVKTTDIPAVAISYNETTANGNTSVRVCIKSGEKSLNAIVYIDEENFKLTPGDKIIMNAELYELENTEYFAEKTYYKSRYIDLKAYASDIRIVEHSKGVSLKYLPEYLAKHFKDKVDELYNQTAAGFIKSLILGDKNGLSTEFNNDLRATGLSHAVSVSGMHISFIIGFLLYFSKNKYIKLAAIPLIVLFALMVGAPQSALRAVIMQMLVILASLTKREYDPLTGIATAALILVAENPYCATDIAFLLSFFATLGIIVLHPQIMLFLKRFSYKKASKLRKFSVDLLAVVSVSVSASLFTMPISAYNFNFVSIIAPITNTVLNLFITLAFSFGFINTLLGFVYMPLAKIFSRILSFAIEVLMDIISAMAKLPFAEVFTGNPMIILFICFVCFVLVYAIAVGRKQIRLRFTVCAIALSVAVFILSFVIPGRKLNDFDGIRFDVLDVGQGQCVVASTRDACAVIDCGGDKSAGTLATLHLLNNGISNIDAMILTHAHSDHANGVKNLLNTVSAKAVYMPVADKENATFIDIVKNADEDCETVFVAEDSIFELGGMQIKILTLPPGSDENENGIVVIVSDGEYETLITGDIPHRNEKLILDRVPDCESYIVGHHGSKTSSSYALLNKALPELAVISVGQENTYGHPSSQTLERLENIGATVRRTDTEGTIRFYSRVQEEEK